MKSIDKITTHVIDNFTGRLTRYINGDFNSGYAKYATTFGVNSFQYPKNLTWMEGAVRIDPTGSVITDLIVAGKVRVESGTTYLYAIGHLKRLYKIQVNNTTTHSPIYDNPVLITTLANSQTFAQGSSMEFYGTAPEQIFIGCDQGVTRINFDGTGETVVGTTSATQWITNVPRQVVQFAGMLVYTNNTNIATIDSSFTVTYSKLSPAFPPDYVARDIRTSADGRYVIVVVSRTPVFNQTSISQDTNEISNSDSKIIYWDGIATGAVSFTSIPSFGQTAYFTFGQKEFLFGYDITGAIVSTPAEKILSLIGNDSPFPNAVSSNGNLVGWWTNGFDAGFQKAILYIYGSLDAEIPIGFYRQAKMAATSPATDIVHVPFSSLVTNFTFGQSTAGYVGDIIGLGKMYFSTLESDGVTPYYRFYYFSNVPVGFGAAIGGVYETQTQLFSKKVEVSEYRIYIEPLVSGNSFQVDLIGSSGSPITGCTQTFTVGSNSIIAGMDTVQFNPKMNGTYAIGVRITNLGAVNMVIHKVEVDTDPFGSA